MHNIPEETVKAAKDVLYYANPNDVERALTAALPHLPGVGVKALPRAPKDQSDIGWTLPIHLLEELRKEADGWADEISIEGVEAIALSTERRILSALEPSAPKPDPWVDTRLVKFDDTIAFGRGGFDFGRWESLRWEMHTRHGSFAVWNSGSKTWSMYGGKYGFLMLDRFSSEEEAKAEAEQIVISLDAEPSAARELALEEEEFAIDKLRFRAFHTNSDADRQAYFDAVSKWFQDRHTRRMDAESERLRFEGDLDKWMKIIGAGITGYQPEAYALMDLACQELVKLRAENASLRSISSPDHADAGKVEGDGWLPIDEAAKSGRIVRIAYNRDDVTMADAFYRDGKWHAACVFYRSGVGKPPYEFREHKVLESLVFAYRPLPSVPSEGAE